MSKGLLLEIGRHAQHKAVGGDRLEIKKRAADRRDANDSSRPDKHYRSPPLPPTEQDVVRRRKRACDQQEDSCMIEPLEYMAGS